MGETTVRPMDGAVEHPRTDLLRVGESIPWHYSLEGKPKADYVVDLKWQIELLVAVFNG